MLTFTVRSYAKINWMLRVLSQRPDGYHDLETIFQTISLHDSLTFKAGSSLTLQCSERTIPTDDRNLVVRAARLMMERYGTPPLEILLEKRIPAGGGLGGGSSNAASTLMACAHLVPRKPTDEELAAAALSLGSDVPFFLTGGTAYATSRGEILQPLPDRGGVPLLLLLPRHRVSTPEAFNTLKAIRSRSSGALRARSPLGLDACRELLESHPETLLNDLEEPVFRMRPLLHELLGRLQRTEPRWARMSGSGSTLAAAYSDVAARDAAASELAAQCPVAVCETVTAAEAELKIEN